MDAATLYMLFTLAKDSPAVERAIEKGFPSVQDCELYVKAVRKLPSGTVLRHECIALEKQQSAPSWYLQYAPQRLIQGVPLELRHMPTR